MKTKHGLNAQVVDQIVAVLARFPEIRKVVLFGSRAKGVQKPGSDIDLAICGVNLDWRTLGRVEDALDDLLLPYCFSLLIYNDTTDAEVAAHIQRVGWVFYVRENAEDSALTPSS
jgi:hypothetical protein